MSDKAKISVTCVKCCKHAVDWRHTLEQAGWTRLDNSVLCPSCSKNNQGSLGDALTYAEQTIVTLTDMRREVYYMAGRILDDEGDDHSTMLAECAVDALTAMDKARRAMCQLADQIKFDMLPLGIINGTPNF